MKNHNPMAVWLTITMIFSLSPAIELHIQADAEKNGVFSYSDKRYEMSILQGNLKNTIKFSTGIPNDKPDREYIIAGFKDSVQEADIYRIISGYSYDVIGKSSLKLFRFYDVKKDEFHDRYSKYLKFCETPKERTVTRIPDDVRYTEQTYLTRRRMDKVWDITTGDTKVKIGIIDTGVNRAHEDLKQSNILPGVDVLSDQECRGDTYGHGTLVTGIIAAKSNNGIGIAGMVWDTSVLPIQISHEGLMQTDDIIEGILYAADSGCNVINMSFGGLDYSAGELEAVQYALKKGCIPVAASGNSGKENHYYPASFPGVISVGSCDDEEVLSSFSSYNDRVDVVAVGENIVTTSASGKYSYERGTSFSAPQVTSAIALALSVNPDIRLIDIEPALASTCSVRTAGAGGKNKYYGYGVLDTKKFIEYFRDEFTGTATDPAYDVSIYDPVIYSMDEFQNNEEDALIYFTKEDDTAYSAVTAADKVNLVICPVDYRVTITGMGVRILEKGVNGFIIKVTAPDGREADYTLNVKKTHSSKGKIVKIKPKNFHSGSGKKMSIKIKWTAPKITLISLEVRKGDKTVKDLFINIVSKAGGKTIYWKGKNNKNKLLAKGKYTLVLQTNVHTVKRKIKIK